MPHNPYDITQITEQLFIAAWPRGRHVKQIRSLGISLILSMHWIPPALMLGGNPRVWLLWLPTFDNPLMRMPLPVLRRGVITARPVIDSGSKVMVHCRAGMHRSVAMASCILIDLGLSAPDAMHLIKEKRPVADPYIYYIQERIELYEQKYRGR